MTLFYTYIDSPVGKLLLAGDDRSLHFISFSSGPNSYGPDPAWIESPKPFTDVKQQLDAYFAGELLQFNLPLHTSGTSFQNQVWNTLPTIPFGETRSYSWLAARVERPTAYRAAGAANGANPLPIILPCHRVIGSNGSLTGFGGGIKTKDFLLRHEARVSANPVAVFVENSAKV